MTLINKNFITPSSLKNSVTKTLYEECLLMNITKTLYEECCSGILRKPYMKNVVHEYYENLTYKQIVIIEKDYNDWKFSGNTSRLWWSKRIVIIENFSSNINEVIKVISSLFYKKILQAKKSTKTHLTFLNVHKKHLRRRKSLIYIFHAFYSHKSI